MDPAQDLAALLAQETEPCSVQSFELLPGLHASVEAQSPPRVSQVQGFTQIAIPFSERAETICFLYAEAKDAAEVLRVLSETALHRGAAEHQWVDVHGGQAAGWPFVIARAHYLVDEADGQVLGDFKIAASARGEATLACVLDTPGGYASFERVLVSLLATLPAFSAHVPDREVITRIRIPGRMVTVTHSATFRGERLAERTSSMRLSIGESGTLSTSDSTSAEVFEEGRQTQGEYASFARGVMEHELSLTADGERYAVSGSVGAAPVAATFDVAGGLRPSREADALVCDVARGRRDQAELLDYNPGYDAKHPTATRVVRAAESGADVIAYLGDRGARVRAQLDAQCEMASGILQAGAVELSIERLFLRDTAQSDIEEAPDSHPTSER